MSLKISNSKIAKNTIYLYIRMVVLIGITFYTSRIVLEALGVDDFGLYNIVGGIVTLFSFLNTALTNASQRYISYELGLNDKGDVKKVFCTSVNCHIIVSFILLLIAESIGLWFVNHCLKIPDGSKTAMNIVYQCSVFLSLVSVLRVPYSAAIISYENMKFYSYLSILEAILKLGVVFVVLFSSSNRLIEYALLSLILGIIVFLINLIYVHIKFNNCRYSFIWDKDLFKSIMTFSGWSTLSGSSVIVAQQGGNILLNNFFGVAINAAYGLGGQVSVAINAFVSNFQLAFQPQIVKLYADKQIPEEIKLINQSSKFSFFLMMLVFIPFVINGEKVLAIWLKEVPNYTFAFCTWILVFQMIDALQAPIWIATYATGKVKGFSIGSCIFNLLNIPVAFIFLKLGFSPVIVVVVRAALNLLYSIFRLQILHKLIGYNIKSYLLILVRYIFPSFIISLGLSLIVRNVFSGSLLSFFFVTIISIFIVIATIYALGLTTLERTNITNFVIFKIIKHK